MKFRDGLCSLCSAALEEEMMCVGRSLQLSALLLCLGSPIPGGIGLARFIASRFRLSNLPVCRALLCDS